MLCSKCCLYVVLTLSTIGLISCRTPQEFQLLTNHIYTEEMYNRTTFADLITDIALKEISKYLVQQNDTKLVLPDFEESLTGVELKANDGWFTNPASILRRGESHIDHNGSTMNVSFDVGFSLMDIYYKQYTATLLGFIQESGSIEINVGRNSIFLEVIVRYLPHCTVSLKKVIMKEFGDVTVNLTGLSVMDSLADQIVAWVLESYSNSFSALIESVVQRKLEEEMSKTGFCRYKRIKHS